MVIGIFLEDDDSRSPSDFLHHMLYKDERVYWIRIKSHEEFKEFLDKHGFPDIVSFDHDLKPEHYDIDANEIDYNKTAGTGWHACKYIIDLKKPLPTLLVHSMNPVGRENILKLIGFNK